MNILFISLGCDKNLVDSEVMLGLLDKKGYQIVDSEEDADIIVVNTCCFIHDAKEESIQTILEMAEYKKEGKLKALIVTGCLAQRYQQEIIDEIPEVDAVLGTTSYDHIVEAVEEALAGKWTCCSGRCGCTSRCKRKETCNNRRALCIHENCRRLRQALYLLYHPKTSW